MSDEGAERGVSAFDRHDAFEPADGSAEGYEATTTPFEAVVRAEETDGGTGRYVVVVRVPMLSTAVEGAVGPAVEEGWFETLELRLEDAPKATREAVDLEEYALVEEDGEAVAEFAFVHDVERAPDVAKTIVEYVEGTYVEGVVPGYEYRDPVAGLLSQASQGDADERRGPTPL